MRPQKVDKAVVSTDSHGVFERIGLVRREPPRRSPAGVESGRVVVRAEVDSRATDSSAMADDGVNTFWRRTDALAVLRVNP